MSCREPPNRSQVAEHADFSFGTNDLTQTTMGLSRDDSGKFLPHYVKSGILPRDPFQSIDQSGVGQLVELGVNAGRQKKRNSNSVFVVNMAEIPRRLRSFIVQD